MDRYTCGWKVTIDGRLLGRYGSQVAAEADAREHGEMTWNDCAIWDPEGAIVSVVVSGELVPLLGGRVEIATDSEGEPVRVAMVE